MSVINSEFKIWVKDIDKTASSSPVQLFGSSSSGVDITFINLTSCSIDQFGGQNTVNIKYFFKNDSLYLYDSTVTIGVAKGNYTAFVMSMSDIIVSQQNTNGNGGRISGSTVGSYTKASLTEFAKEFGITQIDTLAYYNQSFQYR